MRSSPTKGSGWAATPSCRLISSRCRASAAADGRRDARRKLALPRQPQPWHLPTKGVTDNHHLTQLQVAGGHAGNGEALTFVLQRMLGLSGLPKFSFAMVRAIRSLIVKLCGANGKISLGT